MTKPAASPRASVSATETRAETNGAPATEGRRSASPELARSLAEVKGQAQFLLYLADQIQDSLEQLAGEPDAGQMAFLAKVVSMYSSQLESKHQGLGERIAETCQEIYVTMREWDSI